MSPFAEPLSGEVIVYQAPDGEVPVDVRLERESVWLSLTQIAELFGRDKSVISRHVRNVFASGELDREAVVAKKATTAADGKTYQVEFFNHDAILSVGSRVNSKLGTQFRMWATRTLREHLLRGFTLNERRLLERGLGDIEQTVAGVTVEPRASRWRRTVLPARLSIGRPRTFRLAEPKPCDWPNRKVTIAACPTSPSTRATPSRV